MAHSKDWKKNFYNEQRLMISDCRKCHETPLGKTCGYCGKKNEYPKPKPTEGTVLDIEMLGPLFEELEIIKITGSKTGPEHDAKWTVYLNTETTSFKGEGKNLHSAFTQAIRATQTKQSLREYPGMPCGKCSSEIDVRDIGEGNLLCSVCRGMLGVGTIV